MNNYYGPYFGHSFPVLDPADCTGFKKFVAKHRGCKRNNKRHRK